MADVMVNDGGIGADAGVAAHAQARRVVDALGQVVRGRFTDFLLTFRVGKMVQKAACWVSRDLKIHRENILARSCVILSCTSIKMLT